MFRVAQSAMRVTSASRDRGATPSALVACGWKRPLTPFYMRRTLDAR